MGDLWGFVKVNLIILLIGAVLIAVPVLLSEAVDRWGNERSGCDNYATYNCP